MFAPNDQQTASRPQKPIRLPHKTPAPKRVVVKHLDDTPNDDGANTNTLIIPSATPISSTAHENTNFNHI